MRWSPLVVFLAAGCVLSHNAFDNDEMGSAKDTPDLESPDDFEFAPIAATRLDSAAHEDLANTIDTYFEGFGSKRMHVQLDRPMYKPGETVWIKTWSMVTRGLQPDPQQGLTYELLDPQGQVVETKNVKQQGGAATNDFELAADAPGGKWTLRATAHTGEVDERPFIVSTYSTPRVRKDLEFVREAYGPGDRVEALVELEHGTGGPLAHREVQALLQVAGITVLEQTLTTDKTGAVLVSAQLPADLDSSDGLLTVLVEDAGVTESISRPVPIVLADVRLAFFPEGGDLVEDLPGRVYFEATNAHGEPADVSGHIEDDTGKRIASFTSHHDGMGRVAFEPQTGRTYAARVTSPVGIDGAFPLPVAKEVGCTVRSYDDVRSVQQDVRVGVRCSLDTEVVVAGVLRDQTLDTAVVNAGPRKDTLVYLAPGEARHDEQGAVQVTVFNKDLEPLAERLVYRNHGRTLDIEVTPDRAQYSPRDQVVLAVKTTDPSGNPVAAELALAVVDDAVIGLADDEEGHMLSRLYLEPELVDSPKDPGFYFDREEEGAARAMDLVMGTKGHRRFEWKQVWSPPVPEPTTTASSRSTPDFDREEDIVDMVAMEGRGLRLPRMPNLKRPRAQPAPPPPVVAPMGAPVADDAPVLADGIMVGNKDANHKKVGLLMEEKADHRHARQNRAGPMLGGGRAAGKAGQAGAGGLMALGYVGGFGDMAGEAIGWAPVRVFPEPDYRHGRTGVRTDFRDTVHWQPTVKTNDKGTAEVRFFLSDAVTNFRVTTEGVGRGYAGHSEATLSSVLPVSLATKLPPAVSAGDRILLPLTVSSTRDAAMDVAVTSQFGSEALTARKPEGALTLEARGSSTFWVPVDVAEANEAVMIRMSAQGGGLTDTIERELNIVPLGFPRSWSAAGESQEVHRLTFQLDDVMPESLGAAVTWHPSSVSTLISGMEGMIGTPGGCFEQTSSTNWPNVAILAYLEAHDGDPRLKLRSNQALQVGYDKLTGYQVGAGGFETWGTGPGKEALSAFGLLQFHDMQKVFPVADSVLSRDAEYLLSARDGKGGFKNSGESAHGYGSAPPDILNGFITYAMVDAGFGEQLAPEIARQAKVARTTDDPYVLALAVRSLHGTDHPQAAEATARLAALQADDGSFPGAASSITRSYEANLLVESTALAAMALMDAGTHRPGADRAADWLIENRSGGTWGATQATALALGALTAHAEASKAPKSAGRLSIEVNGEIVDALTYEADASDALVLDDWGRFLRQGDNTIVLRQEKGEPLPFSVQVDWSSITPDTSPGAELSLATTLDTHEANMGDTVRLTARVHNEAGRIVPSPIARIGLPAGLEAQTWQLEQLQERGEIAFFETRPREVTLYWDGLHKNATHEVNLDLVAAIPGSFTAPASSAYPYYNDDEKAWDAGLKVAIAR